MERSLRQTVSIVLAALFLVAALSVCASTLVSAGRPPNPDDIEAQILCRLNERRAANGAQTLTVNEDLAVIAQQRSDDMLEGHYFGHLPPPGRPTLDELTVQRGLNAAYTPVENLAFVVLEGPFSASSIARDVVAAWENSPDHWLWAMHPEQSLTGIGVAVDQDRVLVTQLFWGVGFVPPDAAD